MLIYGGGTGSFGVIEDFYRFFRGTGVRQTISFQPSGGEFGMPAMRFRPSGSGGGRSAGLKPFSTEGVVADFFGGWVNEASGICVGADVNDAVMVQADRIYGRDPSGVFVDKYIPTISTPFWVELGIVSGRLYLYINGLLRVSVSTTLSGFNQFFTSRAVDNNLDLTTTISGCIFWDSTDAGDGFNTFPMGPMRFQSLQNTGAGSNTEWTPRSGENWEATKSNLWTGGAGVEAFSSGLTDTYEVDDLAWNTTRILSIEPRVAGLSLSDDGGSIKPVSILKGVKTVYDPVALPQISPEVVIAPLISGAGLTKADIDSAQFGFEST